MKIISLNGSAVAKTCKILESGGLVIAPSDTVYGLLVDATSEKAVKKLIEFKNRPWGKPISVFVYDIKMLKEEVNLTIKQEAILGQSLPGPFTIILPSKHKVSKLLESEKGTLGVRIPEFPFLNELSRKFGKPITATSANLSGRAPHYNVDTLLNELPRKKKELINAIIDAGRLPHNKPSTVVDLTGEHLKIVRQGDIVFSETKSFTSDSPAQTKKIAQFILKKQLTRLDKPLAFIIEGELGVGKTVFVKGIGESFGIENIISPTFTVSYEYQANKNSINKLIHFDLYNIVDPEEFRYLGIDAYLNKRNILCFEWGEKTGEILELLKKRCKIIFVKMKYLTDKKREIKIKI